MNSNLNNNNNDNNNSLKMNNDNNKIITLPNYIIKYMIKLVCNHINYYSKAIDPFAVGYTYRDKENEIKSLMINISLVSKMFFKTLSNNLYVMVDFNIKKLNFDNQIDNKDNDNDYNSILNINNIKVLKLHYSHNRSSFYIQSGNNPNIKLISFEIINEKIKQIKTLEKLVIRNFNTHSHNLDFLSLINIPNTVKQIKILEILVTNKTQDYTISNIHHQCKKLYAVAIASFKEQSILFQIFDLWFNSIKQVLIVSSNDNDNNTIPFLKLSGNILNEKNQQLNQINYLVNIKYYDFVIPSISLKELYILLLASPKLESLVIGICLDRLNYIFSNEINKNKLKCNCRSIFYDDDENTIEELIEDPFFGFSHFDDNDNDDEQIKENRESVINSNHQSKINEALLYWNKIKYLNQVNSKLKYLKIKNYCNSSSIDNLDLCDNFNLNNNCLTELSSLLLSPKFKNIQQFNLDLNKFNLLPFLNNLNFKNLTISRYIFKSLYNYNADIENQIKNIFNSNISNNDIYLRLYFNSTRYEYYFK